ncbi:hypothetical protein Hokovirus_1_247 [Hokovirus HKV1]|uniref:Uncharacterized protein n=1 Tax=Hokovirus HKV1 TaxID=1977638 RepID=A0A1V0SFF7_9VIRU|nr:hypothetical protein Hokovirus_1_247 [Hokovirus HKV1]
MSFISSIVSYIPGASYFSSGSEPVESEHIEPVKSEENIDEGWFFVPKVYLSHEEIINELSKQESSKVAEAKAKYMVPAAIDSEMVYPPDYKTLYPKAILMNSLCHSPQDILLMLDNLPHPENDFSSDNENIDEYREFYDTNKFINAQMSILVARKRQETMMQ